MTSQPSTSHIACLFPGQGSQRKGMGGELFDKFPHLTSEADQILGYSIEELCRKDADRNLRHTAFTQPALFVVNTLTWLDRCEKQPPPAFLAGHSLGEFNALFAAGCMDFATGLRLVQKRGELMSRVQEGGMAAVLDLAVDKVQEVLRNQAAKVDIANFNLPGQLVLSGPKEDLENLVEPLEKAGARKCVVLNVSGAFHSRYMEPAAKEFASFLSQFSFSAPEIPVLANTSAELYDASNVAQNLVAQIRTSVRWSDILTFLSERGVTTIEELGPGTVLTKMWSRFTELQNRVELPDYPDLGSAEFRQAYGLRNAYLAGSPAAGVRTPELVAQLGEAGLFGFLDIPHEDPAAVARELRKASRLAADGFGISLRDGGENAPFESLLVDEALAQGVRFLEVSGYYRVTPNLVRFRFRGASSTPDGQPHVPNRLLARVSRLGTASLFLDPPPQKLIDELVHLGKLTTEEAEIASRSSLASEICALTGTADGGDLTTLLPALQRLRDQRSSGPLGTHKSAARSEAESDKPSRQESPVSPGSSDELHIGAAGALGTPDAIACAFFLGADFVQTGSINLCAKEAGTPSHLKKLLAGLEPGDTTNAPAAAGFTLGSRLQVVKKGSFFAPRAQKLYELYRFHDSLDAIPSTQREKLEASLFRRSLDEIRDEISKRSPSRTLDVDPKLEMAQIFTWYLQQSQLWAFGGSEPERLNYQIPCDESLAAFNLGVSGTPLEDPGQRAVTAMAAWLLEGASKLLKERSNHFSEG